MEFETEQPTPQLLKNLLYHCRPIFFYSEALVAVEAIRSVMKTLIKTKSHFQWIFHLFFINVFNMIVEGAICS